MRFEVIAAKFRDIAGVTAEPGKTYKAGEIVETDKDLDKHFTDVFKKVGGKTQAKPDGYDKGTLDKDDNMDGPLAAKSEEDLDKIRPAKQDPPGSSKFKTTEGKIKKVAAKDDAATPAKGKKVPAAAEEPEPEEDDESAEATTENEEEGGGNETEEEAPEKEEVDYGTDVSREFIKAKPNGLTVFKDEAGKFVVVHKDDPTEPIHDGELKSKAQVMSVIAKYLKG